MAVNPMSVVGQTDSPYLNWVASHSPNGFSLGSNGTIWINIAPEGQVDDYAIRAEDLLAAQTDKPNYVVFWVRGMHKNNRNVAYRESMTRYAVDCQRDEISVTQRQFYRADGGPMGSEGPFRSEYIVPGTYGEEYHRLMCIVGR